jgi:myo-inositol-1(or 4)-monophosphatase
VDDVAVARALVEAAGDAVLRARETPVQVQAKTSATDIVTEADHRAEAAMVALLAEQRPDDGVLGEEGAEIPGRERTWVLDALDGTMNFASGLPGFCCAAALLAGGERLASAVLDPLAGTLYAAAAGEGARCDQRAGAPGAASPGRAPLRTAGPTALADAVVATFAHPDKTGAPGVVGTFARLIDRAGQLRITGTGTLELAWLAAGRLHAWAQPDVYPWDWHPGALLVLEAGGAVRTVDAGGTPWQLAAANARLLDALALAVAGDAG